MAVPGESPVRNRVGWHELLGRLQGSAVHFDLSGYDVTLAESRRHEAELGALPDGQIAARFAAARRRVAEGEPLEAVRPVVFALACEASHRAIGQRPYDVQVVAAAALSDGAVVEMQTGEGKTLAAVMPAALRALEGRGVHVLTFNDYLAGRDAAWMGPAYRLLGLSVGHVEQGMQPEDRRAAYACDVTYVTAKEAGFDYLRDLLAMAPSELVHRGFHAAIVDEADSLMIDEARVPLVIAGSVDRPRRGGREIAAVIATLAPGVHYQTDEYERDVELTDAGIERVEHALGCGSLHSGDNDAVLQEVNCALHARVLLKRDVDYIVRDGRIELVDEFTGRVVRDRVWPDGLQAALEAKEGLARRGDGQVLGSITLQRFLGRYQHLSGMTGTAQEAARELRQVYELAVVVVPTHRPMIRVDRPDLVFTTRDAKEQAVAAEVHRAHASGRPVLVGTATVEESERLAARLQAEGVRCQVLNAKNDAGEARIVAGAGAAGAVTISTNMAGRGTDIRLGGEREEERERVASLGGLYAIGTNRHESRRVDLQLRGRAGRQGDPGESRFFVSTEDDLQLRFGLRDVIRAHVPAGHDLGPIDNPVLRREIARAQRIVEGQNFEIRRTLSRYAAVLEDQHESLMERRQALLLDAIEPDVWARDAPRYQALVAAAGIDAVRAAERTVTLFLIDRAWRDHLELCASIRDGIHLVRLGGQDPLHRFTTEAMQAFSGLEAAIDDRVLAGLAQVRAVDGRVDLTAVGIKRPSSTWTYLVNDDPFRNQIGALLTGAGGVTVAIYSAFVLMPLLLLWGVVERFLGRRNPQSARRTSHR